jgi:hypothetical protein
MAKIQIYESQVAQQPVDAGQVEPSLFTGGGEMMREQAQALEEINQQYKKIRDVNETTKASVELQTALTNLEARSVDDNDFSEQRQAIYQREAEDALNKSALKITDSQLRNQFLLKGQLTSRSTVSNVKATFRKKQIDDTLNSAFIAIESYYTKFIEEADSQQALIYQNDALEIVERLYANDIITAEKARTERDRINDKWTKDRHKQQVMEMVTTDPEQAEQALLENKFPELSAVERDTFLNLAQRRKEQIAKDKVRQEENIRKDNAVNLSRVFSKNGLESIDPAVMYSLVEQGKLGMSFADAVMQAKFNPIDPDELDKTEQGFYKAIDAMFEIDNIEPAQRENLLVKRVEDFLNSSSEGKINQSQLNILTNFLLNGNEEKNNWLKNLVENGKTLAGFMPPFSLIKNLMSFMDRVNKGEEPRKVANETLINTTKEVNPYLKDIPEKGKIFIDPVSGIKRRVFPDGSYEDVQ